MKRFLLRLRGPFLAFCASFLLMTTLGWAFDVGLGWLLLLPVLAGAGVIVSIAISIYQRTGHL